MSSKKVGVYLLLAITLLFFIGFTDAVAISSPSNFTLPPIAPGLSSGYNYLDVEGNYLYISEANPSGLSSSQNTIFSILNPSSPQLVRNFSSSDGNHQFKDIEVANSLLYRYAYYWNCNGASCTNSYKIYAYNTSTGTSLGSWSQTIITQTFPHERFTEEIYYKEINSNKFLFLPTHNYYLQFAGGIDVFNVTNPASITRISSKDFGIATGSINLKDNYAYILGESNITQGPVVAVLDISNPSSPSMLSQAYVCEGTAQYPNGAHMKGSIDGNNLYVYCGSWDYPSQVTASISKVDISNPNSLQVESYEVTNIPRDNYPSLLYGKEKPDGNHLLYLKGYWNGFYVIQLSKHTLKASVITNISSSLNNALLYKSKIYIPYSNKNIVSIYTLSETGAECSNGFDDDNDGFTDLYDLDCGGCPAEQNGTLNIGCKTSNFMQGVSTNTYSLNNSWECLSNSCYFCKIGYFWSSSGDDCIATCGDGIKTETEQCDDGNTASGDGCSSICILETPSPVCGNSIVETGEQCDDGNVVNGDGCSSVCLTETVTPPEAHWSLTSGGSITSSATKYVGQSLYMVGNNLQSYEGQILQIELWEDDSFPFSDKHLRDFNAIVTAGVISVDWVISSTDVSDMRALIESSPYEPYFKVKDDAGVVINTSNTLSLTIIEPPNPSDPIPYWSESAGGAEIPSKLIENLGTDDLYMNIENSGLPQGTTTFQVYEDDYWPFSDDTIRTSVTGNVESDGTATAIFTLQQTDWNNGNDEGNDANYQMYYFKAGEASEIISPNINITISEAPLNECLTTSFCSDYSTQSLCEADGCNVGKDSVPSSIQSQCGIGNVSCGCWWNTTSSFCSPKYSIIDDGGSEGSCRINQNINDDCDDGFLSFGWIGTWFGPSQDPIEKSQCESGGVDTVACPAQVQLPFFGIYNVIIILVLAVLIYWIISNIQSKKKNTRTKAKRR